MNLGEYFSDAEKAEFVERHLLPGHVIKLFCHTTKRPKEKKLVIASINPELLLFLINSELPRFKENTPHLKVQQIPLKVNSNQEFLDHESWLDCSEVFREFSLEEVKEILLKDTSRILGGLSSETILQVMDAVSDSETLAQRHINAIISEIK